MRSADRSDQVCLMGKVARCVACPASESAVALDDARPIVCPGRALCRGQQDQGVVEAELGQFRHPRRAVGVGLGLARIGQGLLGFIQQVADDHLRDPDVEHQKRAIARFQLGGQCIGIVVVTDQLDTDAALIRQIHGQLSPDLCEAHVVGHMQLANQFDAAILLPQGFRQRNAGENGMFAELNAVVTAVLEIAMVDPGLKAAGQFCERFAQRSRPVRDKHVVEVENLRFQRPGLEALQ